MRLIAAEMMESVASVSPCVCLCQFSSREYGPVCEYRGDIWAGGQHFGVKIGNWGKGLQIARCKINQFGTTCKMYS